MVELGKMFGWTYKIVERGGGTIASKLVRSNPWANSKCGRKMCLPCLISSKPINCTRRNLVYETFCKACGEGVGEDKYVYVGESARSVCERYGEHVGDFRSPI